MNTIEKARSFAALFKDGSWQRHTVELLVQHAQGPENAKSMRWLINRLDEVFGLAPGAEYRGTGIQNKVISPSRRSGTDCFICSCCRGFYLPMCEDDVTPMRQFYVRRISQETYHQNVLSEWVSSMLGGSV